MIVRTLKTIAVLSVTVVSIQAQAGIGKLKSVKMCVDKSSPQQCTTLKLPKNTSCSVTTTSLSAGRIGDSDFRGVYSIPAAGKTDSTFKSSVMEYGGGGYGAGIVRGPFGGSQIGEWNGSLKASVGGKYKVTIKNFYLYERSGKAGFYTEYFCSL